MKYYGSSEMLAPTLKERAKSLVPSVDAIQYDFASRLDGTNPGIERLKTAAEHAKSWGDLLDNFDTGQDPQNASLSYLFVDALEYQARDHLITFNAYGHLGHKAKEASLINTLTSRGNLISSLHAMVEAFPLVQDSELFEAFQATMEDARRLLIGNSRLSPDNPTLNGIIGGICAEYKVYNALIDEGYVWTRYSDVREDRGGTDIVVPVTVDGKIRSITVQVKSNLRLRGEPELGMWINYEGLGHLTVWLQTDFVGRPLRLSLDEATYLKEKIEEVREFMSSRRIRKL